MQKAFILLFFACLTWVGCTPAETTCEDTGLITGLDPRRCACCGGYFIELADTTYRIAYADLPQEVLDALEDQGYPLAVRLDWEPVNDPCLGDEITVSCVGVGE
ncbi:MAG: hypothetical protein D6722_20195 [Bacteroidetes bacterium]|nr:MAG: hypothetical protein D6722_20195 [Bacteroidota bacterium]